MSNNIHIFLGPSFSAEKARKIVDATFHPPVALGDLYQVCSLNPDKIAIIDGFFQDVPTVWHKEILYTLSKGIPVYGASSMGAIRGAELEAFGMIGVGQIQRQFATGELQDDDEVAIMHGPPELGYPKLSEAMVNIRYGLNLAIENGVISKREASTLENFAKECYFPKRNWTLIFEMAGQLGISEESKNFLKEFIEKEKPDLKAKDAEELLTLLALERSSERTVAKNFEFESTWNWEKLERLLKVEKIQKEFNDFTGKNFDSIKRTLKDTNDSKIDTSLFNLLVARESERHGWNNSTFNYETKNKIEITQSDSSYFEYDQSGHFTQAKQLLDWQKNQLLQRYAMELNPFLIHLLDPEDTDDE